MTDTVTWMIFFITVLLMFTIYSAVKKREKKTVNMHINSFKEEIEMPNAYTLSLPTAIENFSTTQTQNISKKIFDLYKIFDYKSMSMAELEKKEWHSWQVSILLDLFKKDEEFFIAGQDTIFHDFLLKSEPNDIKNFMRSIIKKYKNYVDIKKSKDILSREYIWTNRDVSIIFYFLANYKNY